MLGKCFITEDNPCGSLKEKPPHPHQSQAFEFGCTVWGHLEGISPCWRKYAIGGRLSPVCSLPPTCSVKWAPSAVPAAMPACCPTSHTVMVMGSHPTAIMNPPLQAAVVMLFYHSNRKVTLQALLNLKSASVTQPSTHFIL